MNEQEIEKYFIMQNELLSSAGFLPELSPIKDYSSMYFKLSDCEKEVLLFNVVEASSSDDHDIIQLALTENIVFMSSDDMPENGIFRSDYYTIFRINNNNHIYVLNRKEIK